MFRPLFIGFFLGVFALVSFAGDDQPAAPSPDLIKYVRDAKSAGLNDGEIQKKAELAGWQASVVQNAVAYVNNKASKPQDSAAPTSGTPPKPAASAAPADAEAMPAKTGDLPKTAGANREAGGIAKNRSVPDDYVIGAGDVLHIGVWKEAEASVPSAVVRPDGKISMPLLKDVAVAGLTPTQVETLVTTELSKFITEPDVTVIVVGINSKKIYMTGAVRKEGPISYTYRMTILQAISEAGGLTEYAKRRKICILRYENDREFKFFFDYDAALRGEHMENNIQLMPGDTIVVPH
jgi:polysaccharide export outer membrane protein